MTEKHVMAWSDVLDRVGELPREGVVYGVPRGGAIVAGMLAAMRPGVRLTLDPANSDIILDDIIDSGATRDRFVLYPHARFIGVVDKTQERDSSLGWVVFPWEARDETSDIEDTVRRQLEFIGENPNREGLKETPRRFIKALKELTAGLHQDPAEPLSKVFDENHDEIVCVRGLPFSSLCEHHLLSFTGVVNFAYIPDGKVVGLSKIPRMVRILASRPQVQERLTSQIVDTFDKALSPRGVMATVEGRHSCMSCRGVRTQGQMVTSAVRGMFKDQPESRAEALDLMRQP